MNVIQFLGILFAIWIGIVVIGATGIWGVIAMFVGYHVFTSAAGG